jgi:DNA-binding protein HU-beta
LTVFSKKNILLPRHLTIETLPGGKMNKAELIEKVSADAKLTKAQTELVLDKTLEVVKKAIAKGDDVKIVGFGTFSRGKRKARAGRNPQTGATITIPASRVPRFKAGKEFKEMVK